jgi:hypothetical protein
MRVAFVVYVEGKAAWTSATIDQAAQLAQPHLGAGRAVFIEGHNGVGPLRRWIFNPGNEEWVQQSPADELISSRSKLVSD